jgi:hypothetical protein
MKVNNDNFPLAWVAAINQRSVKKQFPVSKKLRLLKMQRASASLLPAAIALLLLLGSEGRAIAQIITLTNGWTWTGVAPTISGNPQQVGGATGTATAGGVNSFLNTISANYNSAQDVAAGNTTANGPKITAPPGAAGSVYTTASPLSCSLTLNGGVQFPDATYNQATATSDLITLTLSGWVNNDNPLTIGPVTITAAQFASGLNTGILTGPQAFALWGITCNYGGFLGKDGNGFLDFSFTVLGAQLCNDPGNNSTSETLTISSVGRVLYQNDDTFVGDVPEPSSLVLLGGGSISLLAYAGLRRKAKA